MSSSSFAPQPKKIETKTTRALRERLEALEEREQTKNAECAESAKKVAEAVDELGEASRDLAKTATESRAMKKLRDERKS